MRKGSFEPVTGLGFVKPFGQPAGSYSDDGSMTLALAQSFIDSRPGGRYDHARSIQYFVDWLTTGRFSSNAEYAWDEGISTRLALSIWREHWTSTTLTTGRTGSGSTDPADLQAVQQRVDRELDIESCSGNGSLMRMCPIGVMMCDDVEAAKQCAREQSRVTHPYIACREACEVFTELLCHVMTGNTKPHLHQIFLTYHASHPVLANRLAKYKTLNDWRAKTPDDMHSSGWVIDTLEVVLWAFFKYDSWREGVLAVVNLGEDSDTAGAVYGALAGAFYGVDCIPSEWADGMQRGEFIKKIADGLAEVVVSRGRSS